MSLITKVASSIARTYRNAEFNLLSCNGKVGEVARAVKATVMSLPTFCPALWAHKPQMADVHFEQLLKRGFGPLFRGVAADTILLVGHASSYQIVRVAVGSVAGFLAKELIQMGNQLNEKIEREVAAQAVHHFDPAFSRDYTRDRERATDPIKMGEGLLAGIAGTLLTTPKAALLTGGLAIFDPKKFVGAFVTNGGYHLLGRFFTSATMSSLAAEGFISCADYACRIFSSLFKNNQARLEIQLLMRHFERKKTDSKPVMHIVSQYLGVAPSDPTEKEQQARVSALYEASTKKAS